MTRWVFHPLPNTGVVLNLFSLLHSRGGGGLSFSDLNTSNCCVDNYTTELPQAPRLNRRWQVEASQSFLMFFVFTSVC